MTPRTCACGALADREGDWHDGWQLCARCAARLMGEIEAERNEEWWSA